MSRVADSVGCWDYFSFPVSLSSASCLPPDRRCYQDVVVSFHRISFPSWIQLPLRSSFRFFSSALHLCIKFMRASLIKPVSGPCRTPLFSNRSSKGYFPLFFSGPCRPAPSLESWVGFSDYFELFCAYPSHPPLGFLFTFHLQTQCLPFEFYFLE